MSYIEKKFNIGALKGISQKTIDEHLKLYAGYVKNTNLILDHIKDFSKDSEKNALEISEMQRRFSFEFDGMRNHEYYFEQFGTTTPEAMAEAEETALGKAIVAEWGSIDAWLTRFKALALTRGIGWAILYYDPVEKRLLNNWSDEQHLGHLTGLKVIFALDMWEHSYLFDYVPADKKKYVEAVFDNLDWELIGKRFEE